MSTEMVTASSTSLALPCNALLAEYLKSDTTAAGSSGYDPTPIPDGISLWGLVLGMHVGNTETKFGSFFCKFDVLVTKFECKDDMYARKVEPCKEMVSTYNRYELLPVVCAKDKAPMALNATIFKEKFFNRGTQIQVPGVLTLIGFLKPEKIAQLAVNSSVTVGGFKSTTDLEHIAERMASLTTETVYSKDAHARNIMDYMVSAVECIPTPSEMRMLHAEACESFSKHKQNPNKPPKALYVTHPLLPIVGVDVPLKTATGNFIVLKSIAVTPAKEPTTGDDGKLRSVFVNIDLTFKQGGPYGPDGAMVGQTTNITVAWWDSDIKETTSMGDNGVAWIGTHLENMTGCIGVSEKCGLIPPEPMFEGDDPVTVESCKALMELSRLETDMDAGTISESRRTINGKVFAFPLQTYDYVAFDKRSGFEIPWDAPIVQENMLDPSSRQYATRVSQLSEHGIVPMRLTSGMAGKSAYPLSSLVGSPSDLDNPAYRIILSPANTIITDDMLEGVEEARDTSSNADEFINKIRANVFNVYMQPYELFLVVSDRRTAGGKWSRDEEEEEEGEGEGNAGSSNGGSPVTNKPRRE